MSDSHQPKAVIKTWARRSAFLAAPSLFLLALLLAFLGKRVLATDCSSWTTYTDFRIGKLVLLRRERAALVLGDGTRCLSDTGSDRAGSLMAESEYSLLRGRRHVPPWSGAFSSAVMLSASLQQRGVPPDDVCESLRQLAELTLEKGSGRLVERQDHVVVQFSDGGELVYRFDVDSLQTIQVP